MTISEELLIDIQTNTFHHKQLSLVEQELKAEDIKKLANALRENSYIRELDLSYNNISNHGVIYLCEPTNIESLNLTDNNIGPEGAHILANSTLQTLNISANPIGDAVAAFSSTPHLKTLIAGECEIADEGARQLLTSQSIITLDLSTNNIKGACLEEITNNVILENLNLMQNVLDVGCCQYFSKNNKLISLNLSSTFIGDIGASHLARNTSLKELKLAQCALTDSAAIALSKNENLKVLSLFNNRIGDPGARALAANNSLIFINLRSNAVSARTAQMLAKLYISNSDLIFTRDAPFIENLLKKTVVDRIITGRSNSNDMFFATCHASLQNTPKIPTEEEGKASKKNSAQKPLP